MNSAIRRQFPILKTRKRFAYFDNAATSQKPESVLSAMDNFYRTQNAPVHRGVYDTAEKATASYEAVRDQVVEFVGAKHREEIIFTSGTTASVNTVVAGFARSLKAGDRVLLTDMEHHAMIVPWQAIAERKKIIIDFAPTTVEGRLDMTAFKKLLKRKPKFVGVSYISNVLGTVNPVRDMISLAHNAGAVVFIDAAQAAAHVAVNVQKLNCDFLAFSSHKMYGPNGVGVLYGKKALLEALPPFLYGGHMIESVSREKTTYAPLPAKFEAGTPPVAEVIGLGAAILFLKKTGWKAIEKHERALTEHALKVLGVVPGLALLGPKTSRLRAPIFSFSMPGVHPHDGASLLDRAGIAVRAGHHCTQVLHESFSLGASMRASLAIYNTKEEIDALGAALLGLKQKLYG
jgi:cysteine desulfurase/selenocysteine lyase